MRYIFCQLIPKKKFFIFAFYKEKNIAITVSEIETNTSGNVIAEYLLVTLSYLLALFRRTCSKNPNYKYILK